MNSSTIRKSEKDFYRNFIENHELVCATDLDLIMNLSLAIYMDSSVVYMKLPLRMYIGMRRSPNASSGLGSLSFYNVEGVCFSDGFFDEKYHMVMKEFNDFFQIEGYVFDVVMEVERGKNVGFSGAFCALLSLLGYLSTGKIKEGDLIDPDVFKMVYERGVAFLKLVRGEGASGGCVYSALKTSKSPILFVNNSVLGISLHDLFEDVPDDFIPIDMALIFSGGKVDPAFAAKDIEMLFSEHEENTNLLKKNLSKNANYLSSYSPDLKDYWGRFISASDTMVIDMVTGLRDVYIGGGRNADSHLFKVINRLCNQLLSMVGMGKLVKDMYLKILLFLNNLSEVDKAGVKFFASGESGGSMFLLTRDLSVKSFINDLVADNNSVDFVSRTWTDGYGYRGAYVEHGLGVFSDLGESKYIFCNLISGQRIFNLDVRNSCELLLDCDDGVIFIKGKKLNSKDVRSSAMTIRALSLLFESSVVSSNDLPKSAFTESHSEFKSKILNPLSRLVKNRASVNLSFEVLKTEFGFEFSVKEGAEYINILEVR